MNAAQKQYVVWISVAVCVVGAYLMLHPRLPLDVQVKIGFWGQYVSIKNTGKKPLLNVTVTISNPNGQSKVFDTGNIAAGSEWTGNLIWMRNWVIEKDESIKCSATGYRSYVISGEAAGSTVLLP